MPHQHKVAPAPSKKSIPYFNRISIRLKIILPYLFLVLVFSIGVAMLASKIILETVDERFTNQLYESGKIASEAVVNEESRMLSTLRLLASMQGIADTMALGDAGKLRELALGTVINQQEEAVAFLNTDGLLILSLDHKKNGLVEEYEDSTGGSAFADWEIVQKVKSGSADALGDKFSDYQKTDRGDYFFIAAPVRNSESQPVGVILIGKSVASLARQIREETLSQVTFYNPAGEPIASTFQSPRALNPADVQEILSRQDLNSYRRNSNRRDFESLEMNYGEILGAWEVRGDMDLGVLGVSLVKNTLITASIPTRIQITALITLTVFIIMVVGISLARAITQPLLRLVKASKLVASGDLHIQVPVNSADEIADLAISFNQMLDSLQQSKRDLVESYDKTLQGWSKMLDLRDDETQGHSQRVTEQTVALARNLGLTEEELANIGRGAMLHDIGKMGIPDSILLKAGPLSAEEWVIMRNHPVYAYDMLKDIAYLKSALDIPYCHHEKWDGSGYPRGLKRTQIPLAARLFAVVDVWDALTSDRPYRKRMTDAEAIAIIQAGSGSHFDPKLVALFFKHFVDKNAPAQSSAARNAQVFGFPETSIPK